MAANDITLDQLRNNADLDIQPTLDLIISNGGLAADMTVAEFIFKMLKGARKAALSVNTSLAAGDQIVGYPAPTNNPIQTDATTGEDFFIKTLALGVRISANQGSAEVTNG